MQITNLAIRTRSFWLGIPLALIVGCQADLSSTGDIVSQPTSESQVNTSPVRTPAVQRPLRIPGPRINEGRDQPEVALTDLWDRIRNGLELQEFYEHPDVVAQLENFSDNQIYFDLVTERASPFLYAIVEELEQRGLPLELALLPFVESSFDPNAYSPDAAVGLWQFMQATAESFGLQLDWWYDGRRDPKASTLAALDYLEELNQQFDGDWLLALAAYNTGDGNVRRAIKRNSNTVIGSEFWDLALPGETRSHVPRVLALASLIYSIDAYPVELMPIANNDPLTVVEIGAQIDLAQVAELAEIEYDNLRALNPGYLQWATHPDQPQHISLPHYQADLLLARLASLSPNELLSWDHYTIMPGDTLGGIAQKLRTSVAVLQRVNDLRGSHIVAGETLMIPRGSAAAVEVAPNLIVAAQAEAIVVPAIYRVRSGDNLWSIARRYDLKSVDIIQWNKLQPDAVLRPGQTLDFGFAIGRTTISSQRSAAEPFTYLVRSGDSLDKIAKLYRTTLEELLKWNNIDATDLIHPGQTIRIQAPETRLN